MSKTAPRSSRLPFLGLLTLGAVLVSALFLMLVWYERNALGERAAVAYLRRLGVPAQVRISRLDASRVAGSLVLGAPDHPALTVTHFEAQFGPVAGMHAPTVKRLVLRGARLRISVDDRGRIDFGELQRLVDSLQHGPAKGGPGPDIEIADSELLAQTPVGPVRVGVDAVMHGGKLVTALAALPRTTLRQDKGVVELAGGRVEIKAAGAPDRYAVLGSAVVDNAMGPGEAVRGMRAELRSELSYSSGRTQPLAGPLRVDLRWSAASATAIDIQGRNLAGAASFAGAIADASTFEVTGGGETTISAAHLEAAAAAFDKPQLRLQASNVTGAWRGGLRGGANVAWLVGAPTGQVRVAGERATLSAPAMRGTGRVSLDGAASRLSLAGSVLTKASLHPRRAAALALRLAPGDYGAGLRGPLTQALSATSLAAPHIELQAQAGRLRLHLADPVVAQAAGGMRLRLSQGPGWSMFSDRGLAAGDLALTLAGGGFPTATIAANDLVLSPSSARAAIAADVAGSAGPLHDARMVLAGTVAAHGSAVDVSLDRCGSVDIAEMAPDGPHPLAQHVAAKVCPMRSTPLLSLRGGRWRAVAALPSLSFAAPGAGLRVSDAQATVDFSGRGSQATGTMQIAKAAVADTSTPLRFGPLGLEGRLRLDGPRLNGDFSVALAPSHRLLGKLVLAHDLAASAGDLQLSAPGLVFAPEGLQPAAVLPGLAALGKDVTGRADAIMSLDWRGAQMHGGATARSDGLQIRTAAGLLKAARFDLTFTSLDPLTSAPDQRVTAERLEAVFPLTGVAVVFSLTGQDLELKQASAAFEDGVLALDPMHIPLTAAAAFTGAVRLRDVQFGAMLDGLNLSQAVKLRARISGELPFSIGPGGVSFSNGRLAAVEPGRLTLKRDALTSVGAASASAPAGATPVFQDLALQALEDLAFTELDAKVDSQPHGRLGVVFHIKGRHDPLIDKPARISFLDALRGRAFDKPLPLPKGTEVDLTLDSSLNLDELLASYAGFHAASDPVHP